MDSVLWEFEAIGTHWRIQLPQSSDAAFSELKGAIIARIEQFDAAYSRFRSDSLVREMSEKVGEYVLPEDGKKLFDFYYDLYRATDGAVTPLIGQLISDAGYDASYSLQPKELSSVPAWDDVILYEFPKLTLKKPALIDVGAAGKGYLVDIVAELLESHGVENYIIDAGGDFRIHTPADAACRIGLEHPADMSKAIGVVSLNHGSICGSAGNRRQWGAYNHIFNPHTQTSVTDIMAVWVVAEEARIADGISTALFFVAPDKLIKRLPAYSFEYLILYPDYSFAKSELFPAELL